MVEPRTSLTGATTRGFTLIELLVVMAIVATLLALVAPRYFGSVERSKETVLRENLTLIRDALDKHFADTGRYPDAIDDLVTKKYLRRPPLDPITERMDTWIVVPPQDGQLGGVYDVKSGAEGADRSGKPYSEL